MQYLLSCGLLLFTGKEKKEDDARIFCVSNTSATASTKMSSIKLLCMTKCLPFNRFVAGK